MVENSKRILLVEDDQHVIDLLTPSVTGMGFEVDTARDGEKGLALAEKYQFDLIVLDVGLPKMSGIEICRRLREKSIRTPILMLTGRTDELDTVLGLEIGADDYVGKPFRIREVEARIAALLRRNRYLRERLETQAAENPILRFGSLCIDTEKRNVTIDDKPVELTALEFRILTYFASQPGTTVPRDRLLQDVWGYEIMNYSSTVTSHISRLRNKIEPNPEEPIYLMTVHGVGYRFCESA